MDADTRHKLGEYYTPDWLAEKMIGEHVTDPLNERVLDPSCGSGTFVFWAVRAALAAADAAGLSNKDALAHVVQRVAGLDLHPVAVTLARVTYLLAIGRDRLADRGELTIPIYLGDS
ncbi:MAG TPA: N-6 DNA methylase, partial [Gaiellaceae bacterium]|nr:N-6 DNA methylase [Gaiellaceae bacterium]